MKIAELSRVSGTHRSTIHHYLDLGLLPRPETLGPRLHHFGPEHVERLREIKALRAQGLGLAEIRERLATRPRVRTPPRRQRRRREGATDRRSAILDAAARLFLDRGFEGADVQSIARAAGVARRPSTNASPERASCSSSVSIACASHWCRRHCGRRRNRACR
ncbi:MerR family transcriptional regulator [Nannocystis sp. ILAH1]|uniref:MerR family transcriptional regulator n=1 Tax=Nannocystis sp. ILAH1 TaxID=2996789 RepID=UPI00227150B4|nr:MerR family transcriptional regulator [Nannocystis sp. ILAH1]MCY0989501.1 MerR family transcriptional regulator [Nannocystis sp. ILAH1]